MDLENTLRVYIFVIVIYYIGNLKFSKIRNS